MNENPLPDKTKSTKPPHRKGRHEDGSLWKGFGLFWGITIVLSIPLIGLGVLTIKRADDYLIGNWLVIKVGWLTTIANWLLAVWLLAPLVLSFWVGIRGRTDTALGIWMGYGSMFGLMLLVAFIGQ